MNIEEAILTRIRKLPLSKQQEVLDFSEFLSLKTVTSLSSPKPHLTPEEKAANWRQWVESHTSNNPPLSDEALHRDSIYEDEN